MKLIRQSIFETNSSSTHSITMCNKSDFEKWKNGELFYSRDTERFYDMEGRINEIKKLIIDNKAKYNFDDKTVTYNGEVISYDDKSDKLYSQANLDGIAESEVENFLEDDFDYYCVPLSYDEYYDHLEYETYTDEFTTPSGDTVVAFGYYGNDY